jgi:hypothetical protein
MAHTSRVRFSQRLVALVGIVAVLQLAVAPGLGEGARAQGIRIDLDEVTAAIRGQDVTIHARTSTEVEEARLFIRNLLDLGPFSELPMERTGSTTWRYVLPLSRQEGDVGRLEYYVEGYQGGQPVAKTENFVISFIDPPFIGAAAFREEPGLPRDEWRDFIRGRISRPIYRRWWVYAIAGAVAVPVTYVLARGEDAPPGPPSLVPRIGAEASRDANFNLLCPRAAVPMALEILGGQGPFDAIFTIARTGGNRDITVPGIAGPLDAQNRVLFTRTFAESGIHSDLQIPPISVVQAGSGPANVVISVIVKDSITSASLGNPPVGQPLPQNIVDLIRDDTRVNQAFVFDVVFSGGVGCPQ